MANLYNGLLWRDDTKTGSTPAQRIAPAVKRFIEKYGEVPDTVFVHPVELPDPGARQLGVVKIRPLGTVRPGYFFVVARDEET